jgi:hypothetical protein
VDFGPDCFSTFSFRVLCVKYQDYVVILLPLDGPACNLYPPTPV